jgi:hypothetical protein
MDAAAGQFFARPEVQAILLGLLVKLCTDIVKALVKSQRQPDGTVRYRVPVQIVVIVCTALAALADVYIRVQLGGTSTDAIGDLLTIALPVYLSALGFQNLSVQLKEFWNARK